MEQAIQIVDKHIKSSQINRIAPVFEEKNKKDKIQSTMKCIPINGRFVQAKANTRMTLTKSNHKDVLSEHENLV